MYHGGLVDENIPSDPSALGYFVQQFAAPLVPTLITLVAGGVLDDVSREIGYGFHYYTSLVVDRVALVATVAVGYALGAAVRRLIPSARASGKWVWLLPGFVLIVACISELASRDGSLVPLFWPTSNGEEGLGYLFLTCPAGGAISYSAAMRRR